MAEPNATAPVRIKVGKTAAMHAAYCRSRSDRASAAARGRLGGPTGEALGVVAPAAEW
ncbi:Uncharacterised protein [Mycobacterium tuberculosis]|uniref:Uncharacterized protein n=1 Tax=Mycobacterium tuberculosis TaxID=1773 RepID=A0A916LBT3_MYCTX|nr:Uncharacterised protein [Mycobacterium tuberculosis]COZ47716.1 Uncharacterised protein [Mycobacterium tuberculosis]